MFEGERNICYRNTAILQILPSFAHRQGIGYCLNKTPGGVKVECVNAWVIISEFALRTN